MKKIKVACYTVTMQEYTYMIPNARRENDISLSIIAKETEVRLSITQCDMERFLQYILIHLAEYGVISIRCTDSSAPH